MKNLIASLILFSSTYGFASVNQSTGTIFNNSDLESQQYTRDEASTSTVAKDLKELENSIWVVEGMLSFDSIAEESSPLVGAALSGYISENNVLGVGTFMPVAINDDSAKVYQAGGFWRYFFVQRKTRLYSEASLTLNTVESSTGFVENFTSYGAGIGVQHKINREISIGGTAGVNFTDAAFNDNGVYSRRTHYIQPKLAFVGGFHF